MKQHYPYKVRHSCGMIAFYLKRELKLGDPIIADDVVWLDGGIPIANDPIVCGSCGKHFYGNIPVTWVVKN